jgi:antitoxin (DNA-binding transcriptional repressor) of toxin-antitoxin stability system
VASVSIDEAREKLFELVHDLRPGDEVVVTEGEQPVARLRPATAGKVRKKRRLGTLRGTVMYIAPDFDAPLDDFKEYIE